MEQLMKNAFDFIYSRFFSEKTELIYDYTADPSVHASVYLPKPEQIHHQIPNPCGWGTGMEDSTLNGGTLLDGFIALWNATGTEKVCQPALRIFNGLLRCAQIPEAPGFVARSISPADGISHYIGSSRDQYTHWVYAAVRLFDASFCPSDVKEQIKKVLTVIAEKCLRDVTPENEFNLLRCDGRFEKVAKMWGPDIGPHECLRLPMFYLATYHVTGDPKWHDLYMRYRDEAIERTFGFEPEKSYCYVSLQVQYSLKLVYDLDPDVRKKLLPMMEFLADLNEQRAIEKSQRFTAPEMQETLYYPLYPWDAVEPLDLGDFGGYPLLNPAQSENPDNIAYYPVREVGECASVATLCPGRKVSPALMPAVESMLKAIDLNRYYSVYAPLLLSCAYMLYLEHQLQFDNKQRN